MKVYQIISESRLTPYLNMLERIAGTEIDRALAYLARLVKSQNLTAKEISDMWIATAKKTGAEMDDVIMQGRYELKAEGIADDVIDAAVREAEKITPGILSRITKKLKGASTKTQAAKGIFGNSFDAISAVLYKLAVYEPILECAKDIGTDYYSYKNGQMTEAVFRESAQYWINDCVGKVAAAVIGNRVLSVAFAIPGGIGIGSWKPLAGLAQGLNKTAQVALNGWLLTPYGREWLAKLIVADTFGQINNEPSLKFLRDMMGGWISELTKIGTNQVQKYTNPAAAAEYDKKQKEKDAASSAAYDKIPGTSSGYEKDEYGMVKRNF